MLGCGLWLGREQRVIADLVGQAASVRTVPVPVCGN